jgi:hypothetical protein
MAPKVAGVHISVDRSRIGALMETLTIESLKASIKAAEPIEKIVTENTVREELEAWLARYFGIGQVGHIYPGIVECRSDDDYDVSYAEVSAEVVGLPLDPTQYLELERCLTDEGVVFGAVLFTTNDGLPQHESDGATGDQVFCLADLADKII